MLARRRRCRRCRRSAACRPWRSDSTIAAAASSDRPRIAPASRARAARSSRRAIGRSRRRLTSRASRSFSRLARNSSSRAPASARLDLRLHADLHRIVLPQRIALPVLGHQQTPRIGMAVEHDAEQVPDFALEPVGGRPDVLTRSPRWRVVAVQRTFSAQPRPMLESRPGCRSASKRGSRGQKSTARQLGEQREAAARDGRAASRMTPGTSSRERRPSSADRRSARSSLNAGQRFLQQRDERVESIYESFCWAIFRWS